MIIQLDGDIVINVFDDGSGQGEWYPDDTVIGQRDERGRELPTAPLRIVEQQPEGWAERAARQWVDGRWQSTGGQTGETDLEQAIKRLRNTPVPELPQSPTAAEIVAQVRAHQRYIEGYRRILLRVLVFIGRRLYG